MAGALVATQATAVPCSVLPPPQRLAARSLQELTLRTWCATWRPLAGRCSSTWGRGGLLAKSTPSEPDYPKAEVWLNRMDDLGIELDVVAFSSVIDACSKADDATSTNSCMQEMP